MAPGNVYYYSEPMPVYFNYIWCNLGIDCTKPHYMYMHYIEQRGFSYPGSPTFFTTTYGISLLTVLVILIYDSYVQTRNQIQWFNERNISQR